MEVSGGKGPGGAEGVEREEGRGSISRHVKGRCYRPQLQPVPGGNLLDRIRSETHM